MGAGPMRFFFLFIIFIVLCSAGGAAGAQDAPEGRPKAMYSQLFPNPTGNNGYEELMQASDLARGSKALNDAMYGEATLTTKRLALADPDVKRALSLIHIAFVKPVVSPRDPAKMTFASLFPELAELRNLARLIGIVEYVALADGKTGGALDAMDDGLRMARLLPADSIISALVFVALDAIAVSNIARHPTQLSYRDCERLEMLCEKWLRDTDSFSAAFASERNMMQKQFKEQPMNADNLLQMTTPDESEENGGAEKSPEEKALEKRLTEHPEDVKKLLQQALENINKAYDRLIDEAKKDAWERKPLNEPETDLAVKAITDALTPTFAQILNKQDQDKANLHLLGTFAALERYKWIHRHYPDNLKDLRAPLLALDPSTGALLIYKREGNGYDLHSAGSLGEDGKTRTPVYLPYRKN